MPWLVMKKFNGKHHPQVWMFNPITMKWNESWLFDKIREITDEDAELFHTDYRAFEAKFVNPFYKEVAISKELAEKAAIASMATRLASIIKTSHHEGERTNAKVVYKRVTGFEYTGPEYRSPTSG